MLLKRFLVALFVVTTCFWGGIASAGEDPSANLTPYIGYHFFDHKRDFNDRLTFGLLAEWMVKNNIGVEAGLGFINPSRESDGDENEFGLTYRLNGNYYFLPGSKLQPYITAGLGGDCIEKKGLVGIDGGLGLKYAFSDVVALRAEAREIFMFKGRDDFEYMLALSFPLGKKAKEAPKPVDSDGDGVNDDKDKCPDTPSGVKVDSKGCPVDSDGDGVTDDKDKCPDTPKGVKVDNAGCPVDSDGDGVADDKDKCPDTPKGTKVNAQGCPSQAPDSDGDGIPDSADKCPNTPKDVKVDSAGCPIDSDGDGVPDYLDKCPGTPSGAKVDQGGCVVSITLKINFDTSRSVVKDAYLDEIAQFAEFMKNSPDIAVEIQGHTDNQGNDKANLTLSQNRADAVMKVLVDKYGIAQSRLSAKGYGESKPIDTNDTAAGRARNRRVEAVVVK